MSENAIRGEYRPRLSFQEYGEIKAINNSVLKLRTPKQMLYALKHKKEATQALQVGSLLHTMILEPETYLDTVVFCDQKTPSSKGFKDAVEMNPHKTVIHESWLPEIEAMADCVRACPAAMKFVEGGESELTGVATLPGEDMIIKGRRVRGKIRVDACGSNWLADIKTSRDYDFFGNAIKNLKYHFQAAWYLFVDAVIDPELDPDKPTDLKETKRFFWIVVDNREPYDCKVVEAEPEDIQIGLVMVEEQLEKYLTARRSGKWPGDEDKPVQYEGCPKYYRDHFWKMREHGIQE